MAARIGRDNSFCRENAVIWALNIGFPPIFLLGVLAILLAGVAIAVVAALLSHLIQKAADLKADQDLTI